MFGLWACCTLLASDDIVPGPKCQRSSRLHVVSAAGRIGSSLDKRPPYNLYMKKKQNSVFRPNKKHPHPVSVQRCMQLKIALRTTV